MNLEKAKAAMAAKQNEKKKRVRGMNFAKLQQLLNTSRMESDYFKFPTGDTRFVVLLNPNDPDNLYCYYQRRHWIPNAEGKTMPYNCPRTVDMAAACPACDAHKILASTGDPTDKDRAKQLQARERYLSNLYLFEQNQVVQCELPKTVFDPIGRADEAEKIDEVEDGYVDCSNVAHPETPRIIKVRVTGSGATKEYTTTVSTKTVTITDDVLRARRDMTDETIPASYDAIEDAVCAFLGISDLSDLTASSGPRSAANPSANKTKRNTNPAVPSTRKPVSPPVAEEEGDTDDVDEAEKPEEAEDSDEEYPECLGEYDPKLDGKMDKQYGFVRQCKKCKVRDICQGTEVVESGDEEE